MAEHDKDTQRNIISISNSQLLSNIFEVVRANKPKRFCLHHLCIFLLSSIVLLSYSIKHLLLA